MTLQQHVLVLPFPGQGHVNPLMQFSHKLAQNGCRVTFVNTEFNHKRVVAAMDEHLNLEGYPLELISVPDGLGPDDDRNDLGALVLAMLRTMTCDLEKVIRKINDSDGGSNRITCIIADTNMAWALEIAHKFGIKSAVINPAPAALVVLEENIEKFIEDGIMDTNGFPIMKGNFQLHPEMPILDTCDFPWYYCLGDPATKKNIFDYLAKMIKHAHLTDWWLSNTTNELESGALSLCPKILPIGPLMESTKFRSLGQFWEEDLSCLSWLNQQPPCSVIYVAFGSFTVFDPNQFKELALGLELTNRPFLWVVREDVNGKNNTRNGYPFEFEGTKGKIVKWAPQKKVLGHPATACFISHCGWNSTMDGMSNGVPFLCWPYFADQQINKKYICDVWKVGLGFDSDEKGIISRLEIKNRVKQLLGDQNIRERSQIHKEKIMNNIAEGGKSSQNFNKFMEWLKNND